MKTPGEILKYELGGMSIKYAPVLETHIQRAMKEYAKMWLDRATDELNDHGVGFPEAYKRVAALRKEIDKQ